MPTPDMPEIQGDYVSWAEIKPILDVYAGPAFETKDFKSLKWGHKLEPGSVPGVGPMLIGTTVGTYTATASMEMYYAKAVEFRKALKVIALAKGHMRIGLVRFNLNISWTPLGDPNGTVYTALLKGCRLTGGDWDTSPGPDALSEAMGLFVTLIEDNDTRLV